MLLVLVSFVAVAAPPAVPAPPAGRQAVRPYLCFGSLLRACFFGAFSALFNAVAYNALALF